MPSFLFKKPFFKKKKDMLFAKTIIKDGGFD
jgi:hypothetical protein